MGSKPPHDWNTRAFGQGILKHVSRGTCVLVVPTAVQRSWYGAAQLIGCRVQRLSSTWASSAKLANVGHACRNTGQLCIFQALDGEIRLLFGTFRQSLGSQRIASCKPR